MLDGSNQGSKTGFNFQFTGPESETSEDLYSKIEFSNFTLTLKSLGHNSFGCYGV